MVRSETTMSSMCFVSRGASRFRTRIKENIVHASEMSASRVGLYIYLYVLICFVAFDIDKKNFVGLIGFNGSTYLKHANVDCLFQTTICSQCHEPLLKKEEDKHKTETCAERLTTCTYCKCQLKFSELDKHRSVENKSLGCVNQIHCPNRCLDEKKEVSFFCFAWFRILICRSPRSKEQMSMRIEIFAH